MKYLGIKAAAVVLAALTLASCGKQSSGGSDAPAAPTNTVAFTDIQPILQQHCVPCHQQSSSPSKEPPFVGTSDDQAAFLKVGSAAATLVQATDQTKMPPPPRPAKPALTADQKATILAYLGQPLPKDLKAPATTPDFNKDVQPILAQECAPCHNPPSKSDDFPAFVGQEKAFKDLASRVSKAILGTNGKPMPPPPRAPNTLSADQINLIVTFVQQNTTPAN